MNLELLERQGARPGLGKVAGVRFYAYAADLVQTVRSIVTR